MQRLTIIPHAYVLQNLYNQFDFSIVPQQRQILKIIIITKCYINESRMWSHQHSRKHSFMNYPQFKHYLKNTCWVLFNNIFSSFKPYMALDTTAFKAPLSLCILLHISLGKLSSQPHLCWTQLDLLKYQRMQFALSELTGFVLMFKVLVLCCITNIIAILFHLLETWELSDEELLAFWQDVTVISTVV